ncbi:DoxX family protein [Candidatus Woesearchaeota archaeon]|nr:DoxX family protein [Candidatus Woesearchaeota archaeon]
MVHLDRYQQYAPFITRIGIGVVFFWFGMIQIFNGQTFLGYLPGFTKLIPLQPLTIIFLNGLFDTTVGLFLLAGFLTRLTSFVATLHLLFVIIGLGYNDIAIRDLGLLIICISIFCNGPDRWSFDAQYLHPLKHHVKRHIREKKEQLGDAVGIKIRLK